MALVVKRRGRPPKVPVAVPGDTRTDGEILANTLERFDVLRLLAIGATQGNVRSLVVSGAAGVGKSRTIEKVLSSTTGNPSVTVSGTISAVNLYKLGYKYRHPGNVIVLDDADGIFKMEESLTILKALCDSSDVRTISWLKESHALKDDSGDTPTSYEYEGSMIFITNLDLQRYVDEGKNMYVPHFEALLSRSYYLDCLIHDRRSLSLWVNSIAPNMFTEHNLSIAEGNLVLDYITVNHTRLRELSLRTVKKLIGLIQTRPTQWLQMANVTLLTK